MARALNYSAAASRRLDGVVAEAVEVRDHQQTSAKAYKFSSANENLTSPHRDVTQLGTQRRYQGHSNPLLGE